MAFNPFNWYTGLVGKIGNGLGKAVGKIGGAITKGLGFGDTLKEGWENITGQTNARELNEAQLDFAKQNLDAQIAMNRENNAFNRQQAIDMFNLESDYNSPINQLNRLRAAGLNPAVAYGQGGAGVTGQTNASTPSSSGSGISAVMPSAVPIPSSGGFMLEALRAASGVVKDLAGASQNNAEARKILAMIPAELKGLELDNELKEFTNYWKPYELEANLKKLNKGISLLDEQITNAQKEGFKIDSEVALNNALEQLHIKEKEWLPYKTYWSAYLDKKTAELNEEKVNTEKSVQDVNKAQVPVLGSEVGLNKSQTALNNQLTKLYKETTTKEAFINKLNDKTFFDQVDKIVADAKKAEADQKNAEATYDVIQKQIESMKWQIQQGQNDAAWYTWNHGILPVLQSVLGLFKFVP